MKFDIEKKGYNKGQVDSHIKAQEEALAQKDERIALLDAELAAAKAELAKDKQKRELITKTIYSAVAKAEQIDKLIKAKYLNEMSRLKAFHDKWLAYYEQLLKRYPLDDELLGVGEFNKDMSRVLGGESKSGKAESLEEGQRDNLHKSKRLGYIQIDAVGDDDDDADIADDFDPVTSIREFLHKQEDAEENKVKEVTRPSRNSKAYKTGVAAVSPLLTDDSESGFNFDEALNPTQSLEEIMKDLGLLKED